MKIKLLFCVNNIIITVCYFYEFETCVLLATFGKKYLILKNRELFLVLFYERVSLYWNLKRREES